jgi:two-component system CheB/CheR fusion protein
VTELIAGHADDADLKGRLQEVLSRNIKLSDVEIAQHAIASGDRVLLLNGRRIVQEGTKEQLILLSIEDLTERRRMEEAARHLAAIVASSTHAIYSLDLNGGVTSWNQALSTCTAIPPWR